MLSQMEFITMTQAPLDQEPVSYNFVGKVEELDKGWNYVLEHGNVPRKDRKQIDAKIGHHKQTFMPMHLLTINELQGDHRGVEALQRICSMFRYKSTSLSLLYCGGQDSTCIFYGYGLAGKTLNA